MYKKIKEKISKLLKKRAKLEQYGDLLIQVELKKKRLIKKNNKESKEKIKILNKLSVKLEQKINSF